MMLGNKFDRISCIRLVFVKAEDIVLHLSYSFLALICFPSLLVELYSQSFSYDAALRSAELAAARCVCGSSGSWT